MAKKLTELAKEQTSAADAQKNLSDAQTRAFLAKTIGDVKGGPYTGTVDAKDNTGIAEANLLVARAVKIAAQRIADRVAATCGEGSVLLVDLAHAPTFDQLTLYRTRAGLVRRRMEEALERAKTVLHATKDDAAETASGEIKARFGFIPPAAVGTVVSTALDAASKILDFFRTDYQVGGIDTKADDTLLLIAVAGALTDRSEPVRTSLPLLFGGSSLADARTALTNELSDLHGMRARVANEHALAQALGTALSATASSGKPHDVAQATAVANLRDELAAAGDAFDAFLAWLTTPDAAGTAPLAAVVRDYAFDEAAAKAGNVLFVRLENHGGGVLRERNILAGLGSMPLYHAGGATASFVLVRAPAGDVAAAGVEPVYGGFVKSDELGSLLSGRPNRW